MVGKLDKAMFGTRDAPAALRAELEKTMIELGFRLVVSTPCLQYHPTLRIRVGHVDDLMCVGPRSGLDFLAKLKFVGPDSGEKTGRKVSEAKEVESFGMTDEYDVQSYLNADFMSKEFP